MIPDRIRVDQIRCGKYTISVLLIFFKNGYIWLKIFMKTRKAKDEISLNVI